MNTLRASTCMAIALALPLTAQSEPVRVYLANGIKVGEATSSSALIWARLTAEEAANAAGTPFEPRKANEPQLPDGKTIADMQGSVAGSPGEMRIRYWPKGRPQEPAESAWQAVTAATDFTHTFRLDNLLSGQTYDLVVEGRPGQGAPLSCSVAGGFRTAPADEVAAEASFCVIACQDYPRRDDPKLGHTIYREMLKLRPDFLAHTGDTLYYDKPKPFAKTVALARFKWNRFYGLHLPKEFHRQVSAWFIKDDHDTLKNDCWPGQRYGELTFARGLEIYREQLPVSAPAYRRLRWGKHLELWFLEGREYRSPNRMADGPDKTILGAAQMKWLKDSLSRSDATFRVVVSATPIVGPDRPGKRDNHANQNFQHEGRALRAFLASQPRTIVICGDRHWQYASHDPVTGLREWCCGSASDRHSGGFRMSDRSEMHDYLKICGGFLHAKVRTGDDQTDLVLRHYDPRGQITNEDVLSAR